MEKVTVVVPCRNEEKYIDRMLELLRRQTYAGDVEVIIADGMSEDRTRECIVSYVKKNPDLNCRVIENRMKFVPSGLNTSIRQAGGDIIIRMDAHAVPAADYIEKTVETLHEGWDIAGGVCITRPGDDSWAADLIAEAFSHPFGVGNSMFRLYNRVKKGVEIDTVPFGSFRKKLWEDLGGFNEDYIVHQDYEFNYRARKTGKKIFLNPEIVSYYYARKTVGELWRQLYRYGNWKCRMLLKHPDSMQARHSVPLLFLISLVCLPLLGMLYKPLIYVWIAEIIVYLAVGAGSIADVCRNRRFSVRLLALPGIFFVMHCAYGLGMIRHITRKLMNKNHG